MPSSPTPAAPSATWWPPHARRWARELRNSSRRIRLREPSTVASRPRIRGGSGAAACALVHEVSERSDAAELFGYAAGGFRDFTRIASSHPEMWRDICVANSDQLLKEGARFSAELEKIKKLLETRDAASLENISAEP